jgi:hypothetical protein
MVIRTSTSCESALRLRFVQVALAHEAARGNAACHALHIHSGDEASRQPRLALMTIAACCAALSCVDCFPYRGF